MNDTDPGLDQAITSLIENYHELNASHATELSEAPSPLEFMRFVATNRPFVVRGGCAGWRATRRWNASYLKEVMGQSRVKVAITPHG